MTDVNGKPSASRKAFINVTQWMIILLSVLCILSLITEKDIGKNIAWLIAIFVGYFYGSTNAKLGIEHFSKWYNKIKK